jgi:hypothetical protein
MDRLYIINETTYSNSEDILRIRYIYVDISSDSVFYFRKYSV